MNILHVLPHFPPFPLSLASGVVHVVYHISNELVKRGHEVTICTSSASSINGAGQIRGFNNPVVVDGVRTYYFPYQISFDHFYVTPKLVPFIKDSIDHFDIAHLHDMRCFQSLVVCHYARQRERPYVLQPHGSYPGSFRGSKLKWMLDSLLSMRVLRDANRIIALTNTEAAYYHRLGISAEKIDIVGNGVDISRYPRSSKSGEFRKKFGIGEDETIILYVGRIASTKGLDLLVDAFTDLRHTLSNVKLVMVGQDAGYAHTLQKRIRALKIEDGILFAGSVSESDKINAYIDADVFVTPCFTGFPLTFLEACACSTPIVTTQNADPIDWIHENVGYVTPYNKTDLNRAIVRILCEKAIQHKFKANCRGVVENRFSWSKIVDQIEEIYRRAASA